MNRGNTDKNNSSAPGRLDRLNLYLAKLMGKRDSSLKNNNQVPSNNKFLVIIFGMLLVLWILTGIYYIPDNSYGLIMKNGKITKTISGLQIGLTLPYPLADVAILDAGVNNFSFGKESSDHPYLVATADAQTLSAAGEAAYSIADPEKYYVLYYQEDSDLNAKVVWLMKTIMQDYFVHHDSQAILHDSTIVMSNEIRQTSNKILASYGLRIDKLKIISLGQIGQQQLLATEVESNVPGSNSNNSPASFIKQIMTEAGQYKSYKQQQTADLVDRFNQLLPQYQANQQAIIELMYYKMLSAIPIESAGTSYQLLNLNLEQFLALVKNKGESVEQGSEGSRVFKRDVNRERIFKDR